MADIYQLELVQDKQGYSLREVCRRHGLTYEFVMECVEYGIAEVHEGGEKGQWRIPLESIPRLKKAFRLHRDLELDFTGLALVLDLLEDIDALNDRIDNLNRRLREWEPE